MRQCLVIGLPNVGKTLLSLRLAALAGGPAAFVAHELPDGERGARRLPWAAAQAELVGERAHTTLGLQTFGLGTAVGARAACLLHDSTGLAEDAAGDAWVRAGMARTLARLAEADAVLHVIDASRAAAGGLSTIDERVAEVARAREVPYLLALNKIDLDPGLLSLQAPAHGRRTAVAPVSALTGSGVEGIWRFVLRAVVIH